MPTSNTSMDLSTDYYSRNISGVAALIAGPYMVTLTSFGFIENLLVLVTFARHPKLMKSSNNVLVMFIAVCDFIMTFASFPFLAASSVANRWLFSTAGCQWYAASMTCLGLTSISLLTCLALERYIVISAKQQESSIPPISRAKLFAVACFVWGIIIGACPLIGWGSYDLEPAFPSCTPVWWRKDPNNLSFVLVLFTAAFFFPVCTITFAYVMIFKKVIESKKKCSPSSMVVQSREIQVAILSLVMIAFFLLSWGPYAVVALLQVFSKSFYVPDFLNIFPVMMAKSSVVWNPVIYLGRNKPFRQAFLNDVKRVRASVRNIFRNSTKPSPLERKTQEERSMGKIGFNKVAPTSKILEQYESVSKV